MWGDPVLLNLSMDTTCVIIFSDCTCWHFVKLVSLDTFYSEFVVGIVGHLFFCVNVWMYILVLTCCLSHRPDQSLCAEVQQNNISGTYVDFLGSSRAFTCFDRKDKWWCSSFRLQHTKLQKQRVPHTHTHWRWQYWQKRMWSGRQTSLWSTGWTGHFSAVCANVIWVYSVPPHPPLFVVPCVSLITQCDRCSNVVYWNTMVLHYADICILWWWGFELWHS